MTSSLFVLCTVLLDSDRVIGGRRVYSCNCLNRYCYVRKMNGKQRTDLLMNDKLGVVKQSNKDVSGKALADDEYVVET